MLKIVYEPAHIDMFHVFDPEAAAVTEAGLFVMKDRTDAKVVKVSDGTDVWGILGQPVYPDPGNKVTRPYNNFEAYVGDVVAVYTEDGYFETDQFVDGTYEPGDVLYVTNEGKLTNTKATDTASATDGTIPVGKVVEHKGDVLFFFFQQ